MQLAPPLRRLPEEQQECFTAGSPSAEQAAVLSQSEQKFYLYPEAVFHHFVERVCRRVLQLDSRSRRTGPCRPRPNYM